MTTKIEQSHNPVVPDAWFDLISQLYDLRPITNKKLYAQAMTALRMTMRIKKRNKDEKSMKRVRPQNNN